MSDAPIWEASRQAAFDRLERFLPRAGGEYARTRNFDFGPGNHGNVSLLSPFVRHRLILELDILQRTLQRHSASSAGKFIEEVFWRTYFKGWLEQHPSVWTDYQGSLARQVRALDDDSSLRERYESAISARTGIDCFDAWVRELVATGYLHNHSRMWFASIWVFTLRLPWQLGADFFFRHLVDGDPASNTLGWRWVCGLHTRGKTYLARVSNITSYTDNRFNPAGELAVAAPPLSEHVDHPATTLPPAQVLPPGLRFGMLITEEDCSPENLIEDVTPATAIVMPPAPRQSSLPTSANVREFTLGALLDAAFRAERHFGISVDRPQISDWTEALLEWATRERINTIVAGYVPVGPAADRLALARTRLEKRGIRVLQIRRTYDSISWPHASKGYFKLKAQIPQLLLRLGLTEHRAERPRAAGEA